MPGYRGRIGIERRGQSSQQFPKKLVRDRAAPRDAALLGMPADDDWVLYAPYNDKTLMRNVVAYGTARAIGRYAARTRFVELRLNGRYHGVYVLMERLELGDDRVPARRSTSSPSRSRRVEGPVVPHAGPAAPDRLGGPRARRPLARARAQRARPAGARRRARAVRAAASWRRHIDEAVGGRLRAAQRAVQERGRLPRQHVHGAGGAAGCRLGPVWDFDISMGNSDYGPSRRLAGWMLARRDWAERLYRDRGFRRAMARRWRELRARRAAPRRARDGRAAAARELRGAAGRELPPLAGARPPDLAESGGPRLLPRGGPVPALVADAADRWIDRKF